MATRLTDVIDISTLQNLQNGFSEATGMAAVITDADGSPVTNGSNITELCSNLIKRSRLGQSKCSGDHVENAKKAQRKGSASVYVCSSGLTEFAAPITSNGELIGAFIGGQVLTESPDESKMRAVASDLGVDPDEYIRALRKIKIYPREKVNSAADFLYTIAELISKLSGSSRTSSYTDMSPVNKDELYGFRDRVRMAELAVQGGLQNAANLQKHYTELEQLAQNSTDEVKSTRDTVKVISDIAMNTRILGFNASIEASLAKESGKGFGVIAQEVRNLADTSKSSSDKIEATMKTLTVSMEKIDENIKETKEMVETSIRGLNDFSELISDIRKITG